MSKKFTEELSKLTTPDIRSVLRWLNNNIEKTTKATDVASMKHDKAQKIIEEKYKPADIEKGLNSLTEAKPARGRKTKPDAQPSPSIAVIAPGDKRTIKHMLEDLHATADRLDGIIGEMKKLPAGVEPASFVLEIEVSTANKLFYIIAASAKGATVIDGPHKTLEEAHKAWPEAILPGPVAKEEDLKDLL